MVSVVSDMEAILGSSSGTVAWSCFGVAGAGDWTLSSSMDSGNSDLGETPDSRVGATFTMSSFRIGVEEEMVLGQEKAKGTGMLCKSARFVLEPGKTSEVEASSSAVSTIITLDDTVVLVTAGKVGEEMDLDRCTSTVACCSTLPSSTTEEA